MKTRIYLFTGFLDSGKSTFINDTLTTTDFCENEKSLLIVSEQGEIEYNQEQLESFNCDIVYVTSEEQWTYEYFEESSKGSIAIGKKADFVILDKSPLDVDKIEIKNIKVLETIKEGEVLTIGKILH